MKRYSVKLNSTKDVMDFVKLVNDYQGVVDLRSGSILIDAKSIMGAMTLAGSDSLEMLIHEEDCDYLLNRISEYLIA